MLRWSRRAFDPFVIALVAAVSLLGTVAQAADTTKKILLIGGIKSHGPAEHDFPNGIRLLEQFLKSSPDWHGSKAPTIVAYPDGWPADAKVLEDAATLVWYFDGVDRHPLLDAARRTQIERLMQKGVGLVALHQASTLPAQNTQIDLSRWLGGARYGTVDNTTQGVFFKPTAHPVSRGVPAFWLLDEFYPTIRFTSGNGLTPILSGELLIGSRDGQQPAQVASRSVAWGFERQGGGRSFGYTGLHYLEALDQPHFRKLLLNAIVWTAGFEVPEEGMRSNEPGQATKIAYDMKILANRTLKEGVLLRRSNYQVLPQSWGEITWYVSRELGNSETMTVGQAVVKPGQQNPRHFHPNCDEILHVLKGHILHSIGAKTVEMRAGDTVSIPKGVMHNAKNIGAEHAVLAISFSSADRQVVGE